jgi:uncharacterized Ntn-hydrolase superfamily protein
MANPDVWPAVADGYLASDAPFPRRLLDALRAGEAAGGDARGVLSAALVVVGAERTDPWAGRSVDLRVDRSDDPLRDLAALLDASVAFDAFHEAVDLLSGGEGERALAAAERGLEQLPGEGNLRFVHAGALAATGEVDRARRELRSLIAEQPGWETVLRSFAAKGLVAAPPGVTVDDLLA